MDATDLLAQSTPPKHTRTLKQALASLRPHDQVGFIAETPDEWLDVAVAYFEAGLERGERCVFVGDRAGIAALKERVPVRGADDAPVPAVGATASRAVRVIPRDALRSAGPVDPARVNSLVAAACEKALAAGFPGIRIFADWGAFAPREGDTDLGRNAFLQFRAAAQAQVFSKYPVVGIGHFYRARFLPEAIQGVLSIYPWLIRHGRFFRNFYYIPAQDFLGPSRSEAEVRQWLDNLEMEQDTLEQVESLALTIETERSQLMSLFESLDQAVYVSDPATRRVLFANRATRLLLGKNPVGGVCHSELRGSDQPCVSCTEEVNRGLKEVPLKWEFHHPVTGRDYMAFDRVIKWKDDREVRFHLAVDITERKRAEATARASEERFRLIAENATDVIYRVKLRPKPVLEYVSPAVAEVTGYTPDEYYADDELIWKVVHRNDWHIMIDMGNQRDDYRLPVIVRWIAKSGEIRYVEQRISPVRDAAGTLVALQAICRDVTERRRMEQRLTFLSLHEPLTGLYNRAYFGETLERLRGSNSYPISLVSTDVDGLKLINDTMGHRQGDELLRAYAAMLRKCFRHGDVVARVGGDEFAAILPRTGPREVEKLQKALEEELTAFNNSHDDLVLSVSVGSATAADDSFSLEETFNMADKNMYRDKLHRSSSAVHGIVKALLTALAAKDYVAEGHTRRVTAMARQLGKSAGLANKALSELELLAEVHDLGKVGIPDHVLFKEGPLTAEERLQIREHSAIGYRIARASPELAHIADMILHHHEWWNGQGYPSGLKGPEIPVACRILGIVDAYDAMTNDRPYRRAMGQAEAVRELQNCTGKQFDRRLVRLFVQQLQCQAQLQARPQPRAQAQVQAQSQPRGAAGTREARAENVAGDS